MSASHQDMQNRAATAERRESVDCFCAHTPLQPMGYSRSLAFAPGETRQLVARCMNVNRNAQRARPTATCQTGIMSSTPRAHVAFINREVCSSSNAERRTVDVATTTVKLDDASDTLGLSETIPDAVTFNLGAGVSMNALIDGHFSSAPVDSSETLCSRSARCNAPASAPCR
jgi:hypothetical protein